MTREDTRNLINIMKYLSASKAFNVLVVLSPYVMASEGGDNGNVVTAIGNKDGIALVLKCPLVVHDPEKAQIELVLRNESDDIFQFNYGSYSNCELELIDASGVILPVTQEWHSSHIIYSKDMAKAFSRQEIDSVSALGGKCATLQRSGESHWKFTLGEAYGDKARSGRKLKVTWHMYSTPMTEGRFPVGWHISATLELPKWNVMSDDGDSAKPQKVGNSPATPANTPTDGLTSSPTPHAAKPVQTAKTSASRSNPFTKQWPWLLSIPTALLVWLGLRTRKQP